MTPPVVLYTYAKCSTCRDAVAWLRERGVAFEEKPIYETPPSKAELRAMLVHQGGELKRLFNTSGLEYKALDLKTRFPSLREDEALSLLASNGKLVKRPFLVAPGFGLVGFKDEVWEKAFSAATS
jgi:arsenate reductase